MPKHKHGSGSVYKRGKVWWLSFYAKGVHICESAETTDRREARRKLQEKMGKVASGNFDPVADRITFEELADDMIEDYKQNGKKSLKDAERSVKVLKMFFGSQAAQSIRPPDVQKFINMRRKKISNGSVNRELAALKRAFNLGIENEKIYRKPKIRMLQEDNIREGFFEWEQFAKAREHLPEYLKPPMTFAYYSGWRVRSEVLKLQWSQVDLQIGTVRLEPGTTKKKRAG